MPCYFDYSAPRPRSTVTAVENAAQWGVNRIDELYEVSIRLQEDIAKGYTGLAAWIPDSIRALESTKKPDAFVRFYSGEPTYEVQVVSYGPAEAPCKSCGRPNDLGVKSCWHCEALDPTAKL